MTDKYKKLAERIGSLVDQKICNKCKIPKILLDFNKSKNGRDGRKSLCRECNKKLDKLYRQTAKYKKVFKKEEINE